MDFMHFSVTMVASIVLAGCGGTTQAPEQAGGDAGTPTDAQASLVDGSGVDATTSDASADAGGDAAPTCAPGMDFSSDPHNCGSCGHDCLGGACMTGDCQIYVVSPNDNGPAGISVDAQGGAYWADEGTQENQYTDGMIRHVTLTGLTPQTLASNQHYPVGVGTDGTTLFIDTGGTVDGGSTPDGQFFTCPIAGCTSMPSVIANGLGQYGSRDVQVRGGSVYWSGGGLSGTSTSIYSVPTSGGTPNQVAWGPGRFIVDAAQANIYVQTAGVINRFPLAGGAPVTLASSSYFIRGIALDSSAVYFIQDPTPWQDAGPPGTSTIQRCGLPDCLGGPTVIAATGGFVTSGLGVDGTSLYWWENDAVSGGPAVMTCAKAACQPHVLRPSPAPIEEIAVTDRAIYWTSGAAGAAVNRLAK